MRKITLKKVAIADENTAFSYRETLKTILSRGRGGQPMSAEEMLDLYPIVQGLKTLDDGDDLLLEDSEWQKVRDWVNAFKYPALHEVWVGFIRDVRDAQTVAKEKLRTVEDRFATAMKDQALGAD